MLINLKDYIKTIESGKRPKGGAIESGIPSLGGEHIDNFGGLIISDSKMKYVPQDYYEKLNKGIIKKNDILVVKDGATTGKVAIVDEKFTLPEACINEHLFILRPKEQIKPKFLFYYFFSEVGKKEILKDFRGATVGGISKEFIDINLDIPSKDNQEKIIKVLDVAKNIIDKRKAQIEALDELVKSQFIEMFGDPVSNLKSWEKDSIGSTINSITAGWSANGEVRLKKEEEKAVLKVSAVTKGYFKEDEYKVISKDTEIKKYVFPQKGDLLFSRANTKELVGATCIINKDYPDLLLPDKLWKVLFNDRVNVFYMKYILSESSIRAQFSAQSTGTSGSMYNVSMDKFKGIEIPVPPIELQNQYASFVKQVDKLKFEMEKSLKELEDNFNSLMQKAFNGQLFNK